MTAKSNTVKYYILFGYNKSDIDEVGYFGKNGLITKVKQQAKIFPSKNIYKIKGFGSPKQWLDFINNDEQLNYGYKFHLVCVKQPINFS